MCSSLDKTVVSLVRVNINFRWIWVENFVDNLKFSCNFCWRVAFSGMFFLSFWPTSSVGFWQISAVRGCNYLAHFWLILYSLSFHSRWRFMIFRSFIQGDGGLVILTFPDMSLNTVINHAIKLKMLVLSVAVFKAKAILTGSDWKSLMQSWMFSLHSFLMNLYLGSYFIFNALKIQKGASWSEISSKRP